MPTMDQRANGQVRQVGAVKPALIAAFASERFSGADGQVLFVSCTNFVRWRSAGASSTTSGSWW